MRASLLNLLQLGVYLLLLLLFAPDSAAYKVLRFSGGGIFFFWQAGAAAYIAQHCPELRDVPVMGASAGSIAATLLASQVSFHDAAKLAIKIGKENNIWESNKSLSGIWGSLIRSFLEEIIPDDISTESLEKINVLVTPRNVLKGPRLLNQFESKEDLINALMASIHIPIFMNGKMTTSYKDKKYIDGSFWSMVANVKGPWPVESLDKKKDVFHIDYNHDKEFLDSIEDKKITQVITPDMVFEMMRRGYAYMEKQAMAGLLPSAQHADSGSAASILAISTSGVPLTVSTQGVTQSQLVLGGRIDTTTTTFSTAAIGIMT